MTLLIVIALALFLCLIGYYFFLFHSTPRLHGAQFRVGAHSFDVEIASTAPARAQGLSGRDGLPENGGMLFVFPSAGKYGFWMKDMKFVLDLVWIHGDHVVGVTENVLPESGRTIFTLTSYYPPEPVERVLEIPAGAVKRYGIAVGDNVRIGL